MSSEEAGGQPGQWRESFFTAPDGTQLFHVSLVPPSPRAAVLFLHGYDDHILRYRHVFDAFAQAGFAVHGLDYRGHGHAGGRRGYVNKFSDYTSDLTTFIARVRTEAGALPLFIVAHSHGGLVAGTLLASPQAPREIVGAVFSSPYYQLSIDPTAFQLFQAKVVGRIIPFLPVKNPLTAAMLTKDPEMQKAADADPLKHHVITPRWFTESNAAQAALFQHASSFTTPLLMLLGTDDGVAHPNGGRRFFGTVGSTDKRLIEYPGMLHEIFMEIGREKPIGDAISWIDAHVGRKASAA